MKYVRALEYVLQNAPVRAKDLEKKVCKGIKFSHENVQFKKTDYF